MKTLPQRIEILATVKEKRDLPYQDIASTKGIPIIKPIYEVVFETAHEELLFSLSSFEYDVLEIGDQGTLVYWKKKYCNEMISFANKIKENFA